MIALVDTGLEGIEQIHTWFTQLNPQIQRSQDPKILSQADQLILYSASSFAKTMYALQEKGLVAVIKHFSIMGKPLLGIGTGMHVFFTSGEEEGFHQGINLFPGRVVSSDVMEGFSWIRFRYPHRLIHHLAEGEAFFSHSHVMKAENEEDILSLNDQNIPAMVGRRKTLGVQFYPEKSGEWGKAFGQGWLETHIPCQL